MCGYMPMLRSQLQAQCTGDLCRSFHFIFTECKTGPQHLHKNLKAPDDSLCILTKLQKQEDQVFQEPYKTASAVRRGRCNTRLECPLNARSCAKRFAGVG